MAFRTFCDQGCKKEIEPVVDKETLIAYCTECNKPLSNVSVFMRRQLIAMNQVRRTVKKKFAWSVKCAKCDKENPPELSKDGNAILCSYCHEELTGLSKPFAQMVKVNLQAQRRAEGPSE